MKDLLRKKGLRATKQRLLLLAAMKRGGPLSVRELAERLEGSPIDQATLYRALASLEKVGLVRRVDLRSAGGGAAYEFNDEAHHHHHLICVECGRLEDIAGCDFEALKKRALKGSRRFKSVVSHSIELYGLCRGCAR